ncbi:MAG: zinc transporter ZupT [Muribaculaceae bacterium]|nr:zinc transporter ZupT [Muribaculaceae bacterium]
MPGISDIWIAIALTVFAGLATGLGGLVSMFARRPSTRFLAFAMGLSAGVMTYISFMELLPEAYSAFEPLYGERGASVRMLLSFFGGIAIIALIDWLVPEDENPHEAHSLDELSRPDNHHLRRTGMMLALAIGIHNFPEGMATFVAALDGLDVALPIVVAIAIHNIPEGVAVYVPIYHSTGSRHKALRYTILSGLAEPVGAIAGMIFLLPFWSSAVNAVCLAAVAGIMVYISFDELLPGAEKHGHHHMALIGVVSGMAIMAVSLLFL